MENRAASTGVAQHSVDVLLGDQVAAWLKDKRNIEAWYALQSVCPWATVFQTPEFFELWLRHYQSLWTPILVLGWNERHELCALLPLAARDELITGVGAHQAEYQGWLSTAQVAPEFLVSAVSALGKKLPRHSLKLKYMPPGLALEALDRLSRQNPRALVRMHSRNFIALDTIALQKTLNKKGNKSKHNRLKRQGELKCRWLDLAEFDARLDELIAMYDFRQGALNDICPFQADPQKREFHVDWLRTLPGQLRASGLFLDDRMISALIYVIGSKEAHLAIPAHAPEHAANSPNKIHIYESGLALAALGLERIDLTPGDDEWKARSGSGSDEVAELIVYPSLSSILRERMTNAAKHTIKRALGTLGISRSHLGEAADRISGALRSSRDPGRMRSGKKAVSVVYVLPPDRTVEGARVGRVDVNPLAILLKDGARLSQRPRQPYLHETIDRLENGDRCYVLSDRGDAVCLGWRSQKVMVADPTASANATSDAGQATIELSGFAGDPELKAPERWAELISHMIADARTSRASIVLIADGGLSLRGAVEKMGFRPTASLPERQQRRSD